MVAKLTDPNTPTIAPVFETPVEVELESARMRPTVRLAADARLCASVVAVAIRLEREHVCDCASCCETCVPTMLNESVSPLFCFAIFCSSVVKLATVVLVFVSATGRLNVQAESERGGWRDRSNGEHELPEGGYAREIRYRNPRPLQRREYVFQTGVDSGLYRYSENRLIGLQTGVIGGAHGNRIRAYLAEGERAK